VRLALGADHRRVLRLVLGEGARLVALGLLIGAPGIYVAGRLMRGVLVGVSPLDPLTLATVGLGLGLVALAACYAPARRVLRLEPAQSLRQESRRPRYDSGTRSRRCPFRKGGAGLCSGSINRSVLRC
jgi:putative ABC transport system permease protein